MMKHGGTSGRLDAKIVNDVRRRAQESVDLSTKAILSHDADAVAEEFSEAFSSAGGDFKFDDRDALMHGLRSGALKYESIKSEIEKVDVPSENVAIVTGTRSVKAIIRGNDFASTFPFKAVHAMEGGKWKVVLWAVNC